MGAYPRTRSSNLPYTHSPFAFRYIRLNVQLMVFMCKKKLANYCSKSPRLFPVRIRIDEIPIFVTSLVFSADRKN